MLGIRLTFHIPEHRKMLFDGSADWLWPAAERVGVPIMGVRADLGSKD